MPHILWKQKPKGYFQSSQYKGEIKITSGNRDSEGEGSVNIEVEHLGIRR